MIPEPAGHQPHFQRLHPLTMIIELFRSLRGFASLIVVFIIVRLQGGAMNSMEFVYAALGLAALLPAVLRYLFFSFAIHNEQLIIKQGLLTKQHRTIPLDRIQNINIHRSVLHRLFGLSDLRIETAAGGQAEASLSALTEQEAIHLRTRLLSTGPTAGDAAAIHLPPAEQMRGTFNATTKELLLAGATQNRALLIIAALFGLLNLAQQQGESSWSGQAENWLRHNSLPWVIGIGLTMLILVGWLFSIIGTYITYYGFQLTFLEKSFRRSYGMFTQIENVVPLRRVQIMRTEESPLQRLLKICRVYVETAGGFTIKTQDQGGQTRASSSSLISPLLESRRLPEMASLVLPESDLSTIEWQPVSPKTIPRTLRSSVLFSLVLAGAGWYWLHWWSPALIPAYMGLAALHGWLRLLTSGWCDKPELFSARNGALARHGSYAPISKIQSVSLSQSPAQRMFGLATLTFRTAATSGSAAVEVIDLPAEQAESLAVSLHQRSSETSWNNPDGF